MIIYSIIPTEFIFENQNSNYVNLKEIYFQGEKVLAEPLENNQYKINRIISTSPNAYLNVKLQPGSIITL